MSDQKLTELTEASSLTGAEYAYLVKGGVSYKVALDDILALLSALPQDLDGANKTIANFRFSGAVDKVYDLATDPDTLITTGTLQLVEDQNVYSHAALASALVIALPATPAAGDAPSGVVNIALASGGSVTLSGDYAWEKVNSTDPNPTLPSSSGSSFQLYYRWAPHISSWLLNLAVTTVTTPVADHDIVPGSIQVSALSVANRDTHPHTHTFVSETQDGSVYVWVGFIANSSMSKTTVTGDADLTGVTGATDIHCEYGIQWWGYEKPSQGELDATTKAYNFGYTNEIGQIISFETVGSHASSPVEDADSDNSITARTGCGPASVTTAAAGRIAVSAFAGGNSLNNGSCTVVSANGFTHEVNYQPGVNGAPAILVGFRSDVPVGALNGPTYASANNYEQNCVLFAIAPGA